MKPYSLIIISALLSACTTSADFNVKDFGAKGNGSTLDSPAINKAIAKASSKGGGRVVVPAGEYLCYSIEIKSGVELFLSPGSRIIAAAPTATEGYNLPENEEFTEFQGFGHNYVENSLIWGHNIENAAISGNGIIDGSNLTSWNEGRPYEGNKAVAFRGCRSISLTGFTIYRGGHFAVHATDCDNLSVCGLRVDTDRDGIDLICSRNVTVSDCKVNCPQDDAIVLKSNYSLGRIKDMENVCVTNCIITGYRCGTMLDGTFARFEPAQDAFRSGGRIKLGTESNGGYKNIAVSNCVFEYCGGLMLQSEDGGDLEDVTFSNITFRDGLYGPIFIRLGERMRAPAGTPVGHIRRVLFSNITAWNVDSWNGCVVSGTPGHCVEDITFSNIHLYYKGGYPASDSKIVPPEFEGNYPEPWMFGTSPSRGFFVRHARNIHFDDIYLDFEYDDGRPDIAEIDTKGITKNNIVVTGRQLKLRERPEPAGYAGSMDHVANASAFGGKQNEGSQLAGKRAYLGCAGDAGLARLCEKALEGSGYRTGEAVLDFGDGGSFTFSNPSGLLPATWKENGGEVSLSFSKVFSQNMTGKISRLEDGSYEILFPAGKFADLLQRVICLVGRQDTNAFMKEFTRLSGIAGDAPVGFRIK